MHVVRALDSYALGSRERPAERKRRGRIENGIAIRPDQRPVGHILAQGSPVQDHAVAGRKGRLVRSRLGGQAPCGSIGLHGTGVVRGREVGGRLRIGSGLGARSVCVTLKIDRLERTGRDRLVCGSGRLGRRIGRDGSVARGLVTFRGNRHTRANGSVRADLTLECRAFAHRSRWWNGHGWRNGVIRVRGNSLVPNRRLVPTRYLFSNRRFLRLRLRSILTRLLASVHVDGVRGGGRHFVLLFGVGLVVGSVALPASRFVGVCGHRLGFGPCLVPLFGHHERIVLGLLRRSEFGGHGTLARTPGPFLDMSRFARRGRCRSRSRRISRGRGGTVGLARLHRLRVTGLDFRDGPIQRVELLGDHIIRRGRVHAVELTLYRLSRTGVDALAQGRCRSRSEPVQGPFEDGDVVGHCCSALTLICARVLMTRASSQRLPASTRPLTVCPGKPATSHDP